MSIKSKLSTALYVFSNKGLHTTKWSFVKRGGVLGKNCVIYPDVEFGSEPYLIKIGDNVRITNGVRFVTHDGGLWVLRNLDMIDSSVGKFGPISVGNNTHIGWNAIIMPGVVIGENCIIGCGSVVTKSIPDNSVAVGVPARVIETIDEYYKKVIENHDVIESSDDESKRKYLVNKFFSE